MNNCVRSILSAIALGASILSVGGCSYRSNFAGQDGVYLVGGYDDPSAEVGRFGQVRLDQAHAEPLQPGQGDKPAPVKRLAITHGYALLLPDTDVEAVQQQHLSACSKLGCTVVSTTINRPVSGRITARSEVRIAPDAFASFAELLAAPPARIVTHSESADDKTAPMLDVEKRLEVKSALRDRLTAMLREPGATSAADLATIEKELAEVQGDIEGITAQRDYLRTITETVRVNVSYTGVAAQAAGIDLSPITRAGRGIADTLVYSLANLISFLAALVPWLPLIALAAWGVRRAIRRWRRRMTPPAVS